MPPEPRFLKAADNTRPHNSHRYDVFAPKLNRPLTLFGKTALDAWTFLESDPDVQSYCERPLVIPDTKPKRIVDFWVEKKASTEFLFLLSPAEIAKGFGDSSSIPAFNAWSKNNRTTIKFINPVDFSRQKFWLINWGWIIRDLSAFGKYIPINLLDDMLELIRIEMSFENLELHFVDIDPVLVRIAAYHLLHNGRAICPSIRLGYVGPSSMIKAI
jgi:hypothetical protein